MCGGDFTRMLEKLRGTDTASVKRLLPLVYGELRRMAQARLEGERRNHTLQATALVHEAYLRLADHKDIVWKDRTHFLAIAAITIRRILVDHARRKGAAKRGDDDLRVTMSLAEVAGVPAQDLNLIDLDNALTELAVEKPDHAQVVELRFFGGITAAECAEVMGVAERTIDRRWRFARAWLYRRLADDLRA